MDLTALEYPRIVYYGPQTPGAWVCQRVTNAEDCRRALEAGWSLVPILADATAPAPSAPDPAPVSAPDPEPVKRKPGRPRKEPR